MCSGDDGFGGAPRVLHHFGAPPAQAEQKPTFIEDWRADLAKGIRMGPTDAPVQLIEFADFECPYCAMFHKYMETLRARYPTQVALTYAHFPLPMHRFAEPAARVAECASDQGQFATQFLGEFLGQLDAADDRVGRCVELGCMRGLIAETP
jgi:hypothetical protein